MRTRICYTGFLFGLALSVSCKSRPDVSKIAEVTAQESAPTVSLYDQQDEWPGSCQRASAIEQRQSPIDLTPELFAEAAKGDIKFSYKPADAEIVDNGHTIQYKFKGDAGFLEFEGHQYSLKQFHFHKASEHTLNGKSYGMEVHFVHMMETPGKDDKSAAVALGFLVDAGPSQADWNKVWTALPTKAAKAEEHAANPAAHHDTILARVPNLDARTLISPNGNYLVYEGSLTTPACDEIVTHIISSETLAFEPTHMEKYASYFPVSNRKIQPLGDVKIRKFRMVSEK
jgi:carbonic anhydrase